MQLTLADGSSRSGQVLEVSGSKAVVQVCGKYSHIYIFGKYRGLYKNKIEILLQLNFKNVMKDKE